MFDFFSLLAQPRTPRRMTPKKGAGIGTPAFETPRQELRSRINNLTSSLSDKNGCIEDLKVELEELRELNEFLEDDYKFKEESWLAKIEEPAEERVRVLMKTRKPSSGKRLSFGCFILYLKYSFAIFAYIFCIGILRNVFL